MDDIKFLRTDFSGKIKSAGTAMTDIMQVIDELVNRGDNPVGMILHGMTVEFLIEDRTTADIDIKDVDDIVERTSHHPIEMADGYRCQICNGSIKENYSVCKSCRAFIDWSKA